MIQIIVRVIPGGDEAKAFEQAVARVTCVPGEGPFRNYSVSVGESQNPCNGALDWSSAGHVFQHDRRASVFALAAKVCMWPHWRPRMRRSGDRKRPRDLACRSRYIEIVVQRNVTRPVRAEMSLTVTQVAGSVAVSVIRARSRCLRQG
jgi:hypothetical protein